MLTKIKGKNFLSWADLEFDVHSNVTLIDGYNYDDETSEGSGKSAIPNLLSWVLFGEFPKDVKIDEVIKFGEKSAGGAAYFDDGTTIIRTRKPNDLYIRKDDKIIKGKDAGETQQLIQDYLGVTFKSFCQSSYFAQNYDKKFLVSNQEDKGKILSDIQDISIFDKARKKAGDLAKPVEEKLSNLKTQLQVENTTLSGLKTQQVLISKFIDDKIKQHETFLKGLIYSRDSARTNLQEIKGKQEELKSIVSTFDAGGLACRDLDLKKAHEQLQSQISLVVFNRGQINGIKRSVALKQEEGIRYANRYKMLQAKVESLVAYITNPSKNCPTCGSSLEAGDTSHAEKELTEVRKDMDSVVANLNEIGSYIDQNPIQSDQELASQETSLRGELSLIDRESKNLQNLVLENTMMVSKISGLDDEIRRLENTLKECQGSLDANKAPDLFMELQKIHELSNQIDQVSQNIIQVQLRIDETSKHLFRLETLKSGFKEIKSYVFSSALNELSFRANEFLTVLFEVPAKIQFSNEDLKIETKIYLNEKEMSTGLLSGGQFRRFCLAIDLALSDMVSSRKTSKLNILVMDEYFQNLSESSMEKCLDLLKMRKCPVLMIEHNSVFKGIVDQTFFCELQNGTSSVRQ